jgi:putative endonuclease
MPYEPFLDYPFFVYILTNKLKTVLYVGFTNALRERVIEHYKLEGNGKSFTGRYHCNIPVYVEGHESPTVGIRREKELKKWSRRKKEKLINSMNPCWENLFLKIFKEWPPC